MWVTFLEILKYTIPSLVVFAACYYILKQYLDKEYNLKALELRSKYSKDAIPLKLQAYERLLLFGDRIELPNLILRLKTRGMNAAELKTSMIISVQKEYEHNLAQQLYVSQNLWKIISLTKNDTISHINNAFKTLDPENSADMLAEALINNYASLQKSPTAIAVKAIKEEAKIILNV